MGVILDEGGASNFDIAIYDDLFAIAEKTKNEFDSQFKPCYDDLKNIFEEMKEAKGFKSAACEGFLETFEILLMFQEDLIKELPELYTSFSDFSKSLNDIYNHYSYKGLVE